MPISSFSIVSLIGCEINFYKPATILDLGCGSGFYGAVIRQWGRDMGLGSSKCRIEGVEPFEGYRNPNWEHYQKVWVKTIQSHLVFAKDTTYDCILFLDVIEHFRRLEGLSILEQLQEKLSPGGVLLVSTPGVFEHQGAEYGNELEKHLAFYEIDDFMSRGFIILKDGRMQDELLQYMTVAKYVNSKQGTVNGKP